MVYTLRFFSLQNAVCFIILTYLVLHHSRFIYRMCQNLKKIIPAQKVNILTHLPFEYHPRLREDDKLAERSVLGVGAIMELRLYTIYYKVYERLYRYIERALLWRARCLLSSAISSRSILEKLSLDAAEQNRSLWLRRNEDTCVICSEGFGQFVGILYSHRQSYTHHQVYPGNRN